MHASKSEFTGGVKHYLRQSGDAPEMTIGDRLKQLRTAAGLTLEQAGAIAGTSKQSMSQIEKGQTAKPNGVALEAWSRYYGVSLRWLATGKGPMGLHPSEQSESVLKSVPEQAQPSHFQRPDPVTLRTALDLLAFDEDQAGPYSPPRQAERLAELYARIAADGGVALSDESNTQFDNEVWARAERRAQGKTEHATPAPASTKPGRNRNG